MGAGKWHLRLENSFLNFLYCVYAISIDYFSFMMVQLILVSIYMYRACPERIMELCCYYVQYTNVLIMGYLSKRPQMRQVLDYISDKEKEEFTEDDAEIYKKYAKINRNSISIILSLTVSAGIPWYIVAFKASFDEQVDPNCPIGRGLCFQLWYPFNLYQSQYWITKTADTLLLHSMFFSLTCARVITVLFMVYVLGQIKIVQNRIKSVDSTSRKLMNQKRVDYDSAIFETVTECARQYAQVQRLMRLVNKACKEFVLLAFFCNSMEVALFLMQLLMAQNIDEAVQKTVVVFMTLTQMFLFLWYANEIKVESVEVANIIYNETAWINYNSKARKTLLLVMMRSQKPLTCNSAFIGDMTIDTFKSMIKLCYSITTFFKTAYL
ncbi:odorant receptor Or2-like [Diabrotica virgifera virgifera]|uniref:Odorant receptor n=1 Tax=Diabrotica virgifera virgifera TaxID=50390 RepID=A0ABM5KAB5_DIAVI|nr:odorant receptor Or2-like [Diabrotica virgifera virgifera]